MSWFDTAGFASFAKSALNTAQKTIDKALDIKDESKGAIALHSPKKPDVDSFFESFGLRETPTAPVNVDEIKTLAPVQNIPTLPSGNISAQNSGFWTDAWGSFFESKMPVPEELDTSKSVEPDKESISKNHASKKDDAVLSQPQRAGLFPGDVKCSSVSETSALPLIQVKDSLNLALVIDPTSHIPDSKISTYAADTLSSSTKCESNVIREITSDSLINEENMLLPHQVGQFSNFAENETNKTAIKSLSPSENQELCAEVSESNKDSLLLATIPFTHCEIENSHSDKFIDNDTTGEKLIDLQTNTDTSDNITIKEGEESESEIISHGEGDHNKDDAVPPKSEIGSEYDIIDLSEKYFEDASKQNPNESLERSASVEVVTPTSSSSLYNSNIEFPDMHSNIAGSFVTWEWGLVDNLSSADNLNPDNNMITEQKKCLPQSNQVNPGDDGLMQTQLLSYGDSFHVLNKSAMQGYNAWVDKDHSSQYEDTFHDSSTEELNSVQADSPSNSSKEEDYTETAELKECEIKSSDSGGSHATTSSSSFVKCSVDEADSSHRCQSPLSATASERSDVTKLESEQNTSGDENETATSSDIEILSPPNGEIGDRNASPLKHMWVPRPLRIRRSESPASDSSKDSTMPVVREVEESSAEDAFKNSAHYLGKVDDLSSFRKHLHESDNFEKLFQRQEDMQAILEAREKRILELSKENIDLRENDEKLQEQINKMTIARTNESKDISAMTKEFTQRLAQTESKAQKACQERDILKKQLEEAKTEVARRVTISEMEEIVKEKDQQIKELIGEGEKLSKKELQHTTIIKKLRVKEDEMDHTIKSQRDKLEEVSKEVERLRKSMGAKDEQEKKHIDAIRQFTTTVQNQEKEIASLQSNLEDSIEKELSSKKALDSTFMELTELRTLSVSKESEIQERTLSVEMAAKEKLRQTMEQANRDTTREKETLLFQMEDLRNSLTRQENESNLQEKMLKADIARLQLRLQDSEARNEEVTKSMSSATRPLVRQIDNLQSNYNIQIASLEKVEKNLTDRLGDARKQLALCSEKERLANEKYLELSSKVTKLESQNSTLRQEKIQLSSKLEMINSKVEMFEEGKNREETTVNLLKQSHLAEINKLQKEKDHIEKELLKNVNQLKSERKKIEDLQDELKHKESRLLATMNQSPCPSPSISLRSSVDSINWLEEETQDQRSSTPVNNYRMSVYDSLRTGSASSVLENLQSQLKQREGEITQLQSEIIRLERERESMAQELVELSGKNEVLQEKLEQLENIQQNYNDLDQKYNTILQMYGEKVEQTQELLLDLADVKSMYKAQIEELLRTN